MFEDLFKDIDITKCLDDYVNFYIDTMPKKIYRKIRFKNKHKKRYIIVYNRLHDYMINPRFVIKAINNGLNRGRI